MANESQGILRSLRHMLGIEKGDGLSAERLGRWIGTFILVSAVVLSIWALFSPFLGAAGGSAATRIRAFWTSLVATGWTGVAIILLAEMVAQRQVPETPPRRRRTNQSSE